jgi:hypothetical protein
MDLAWDDKLEFAVLEYNWPGDIANVGGIDYIYQGFAYDGIPTALSSLPTSGVDTYWGETMGVEMYPELMINPIMSETRMAVNWANRKVFGTILDMGGPYPVDHVHFYGDLNAGPASFRIVSGEGWTGPSFSDPWTSSGTLATGQFFGSEYQGFGFTASGTDYRLADMSAQGSYQAIGGLFREPGMTTASPAGVKSWTGFYVGTSDNIVSPTYTNIHQNTFSLVLDANNGDVAGNWLFNPVGYPINIPLGGSGNSAYVDDQQFVAEFVPGTYTNMMSVNVSSEGSFLVTADPGFQFSDYASWGYWNMVYNGTQQFHSPGSFWVAGESTLASVIDSYRTSSLAATYTGPAYGVQIDAGNNMTPLTGGNTNLTVLFGSGFISGQIGFDQATLNVAGPATISGSTMTSYNSVTGASSSSLVGGFYGPNAETMAGTFQANMGANRYSGIFGGNGAVVLP